MPSPRLPPRPARFPVVFAASLAAAAAVTLLVASSLSTPALATPVAVAAPASLASAAAPGAHPLSHGLPSEAAEHMEGLIRFLPPVLRDTVSSSTGFTPAFLQSFLLILACEIGDRTFFVAAILAMKASRLIVWAGALSALAAMTILSAAIGKAFPLLLDRRYTSIAAAALFFYFGVQLLRDWWRMRHAGATNENEELVEVEEELRNDDDGAQKNPITKPSSSISVLALFSPVFAKALSMTALAEWGDRSQIATIALAASRDMFGVIVGGIAGHAICTGVAVIGGRLLATRISERAVALMGGILFVIFAILTVSGYMD